MFDSANYLLLASLAVTMLYPFLNTLAISLADRYEAYSMGLRLLPKTITFAAYQKVLEGNILIISYANTIFRTVIGTALSVFACFSGAFVLAKKGLPYKDIITFFFVFTMFFSGGLIPSYLLIKDIGLINNRLVYIIPSLYNVWNMVLLRNSIQALPYELEEAALMDGAGPFYIMLKVIFPLCVPIIATISLWTAVGHWNAWFDALIYITNQNKQVLQMILRRIVMMEDMKKLFPQLEMTMTSQSYSDLSIKSATIIITIGPIIILYPFLQKYYIKGILIGSLKG